MACCNGTQQPPLGGAQPETPACCPSRFCDDRLLGLPTRTKIRLLGTEEKCMVQFPKDKPGVLLVDQFGYAIVTDRPKIPMPYLKQYVLDGGKPIPNPSGTGFIEDIPPPFDSFVVSSCDGFQNRIQGTAGQKQRIMWTGCNFAFLPDNDDLALEDFQYVGASHGFCDTFELCLVNMTDGTVKMGYRAKPTLLVGAAMMWFGPKNKVTAGWIVCEGQALSKALYPDLFSAIGYSCGGSGNTFYAPKPNGLTVKFVDDGAGVDPGAASRTAMHAGGNTGDKAGTLQTGKVATDSALNNFGAWLIMFAGCVKSDSPAP